MTKISPVCRNENRVGIRWCQQEMQTAIPLLPAKYSHRLSFKRMARANDDDLLGKDLVVGSLSIDPSIESITTA